MMVETLDTLARNAFLSGAYKLYGVSTGTGFDDITSSDRMNTAVLDDIHLGMAERGVPYASGPEGVQSDIFCITTPGVIYDLRAQAGAGEWVDAMNYGAPVRRVTGEVGTYRHVRFIQAPGSPHNMGNGACLYNAGTFTKQVTLTAAHNAGDGSPDPATTPVDGVYKVGQPGATAQHYLQCSDFADGEFAVNDIVTIHVDRTSANGVTNGVDYTDGKLQVRRVVAVNHTDNRLTLDKPLMEDFTVDLGSGVYGYVTKGRHIHTAVFIGGSDGVVLGVGRNPSIKTPKPVDDLESMYRIAWEGYLGYTVFEPTSFEVWVGAGSNRVMGPRISS